MDWLTVPPTYGVQIRRIPQGFYPKLKGVDKGGLGGLQPPPPPPPPPHLFETIVLAIRQGFNF